MKEINHYKDSISEPIKGHITIDEENYFSELSINKNEIKIRIFDLNSNKNINYSEIVSLHSIIFNHGISYYLLFDLKINKISSMSMENNGKFNDYIFLAQGFLHSRRELYQSDLFKNLSVYGDNIKKWSGFSHKLDSILNSSFLNKPPNNEDCIEFERKIQGLGIIGLYYSYRFGQLDDLHTVGMSVEPRITITFEKPVSLDKLIEHYTDLYMILRFFIGDSLMISNVWTQRCLEHSGNHTQFYLAEKKDGKKAINSSMLLPYSTIYRDNSENTFPELIWENYYNPENTDTKKLIKQFMTYSMIHNNEERFLGFYRIIEAMTAEKSCYVDEDRLLKLLDASRGLLAKKLPGTSISKFIRAVKKANRSKSNTQMCIQNFIKKLPNIVVEDLKIKDIDIAAICDSRNKIIHQPLFLETPEKIYNNMNATELLTKLALLIRLGIPNEKLEDLINQTIFPVN